MSVAPGRENREAGSEPADSLPSVAPPSALERLSAKIAELDQEIHRIGQINTAENRSRVVPELTVWAWLQEVKQDLAALTTEQAQLQQELENERMRLAACTSAALGNTPGSIAQRLPSDHAYWSASYGDVCRAVDREIAAEGRAARAEAKTANLRQRLQDRP